jgi:hypothetical protein
LNGPVRGSGGVFVYVVETITEAPPMTGDIKELKKQLASSLHGRVELGFYTRLHKKAGF